MNEVVEPVEDLLTIGDACRMAGVSRWTIQRARRAGKLRVYRLGGCTRVSRQQLRDWYALCETQSTAQRADGAA